MARGIRAAVGVKGRNLKDDVRVIQILLNAALRKDPRFKATGIQRLAEDDDCGPKTEEAIRKYQEAVLGWRGNSVDGTVHPGRNTWRSLNGNTGTTRGEPAPKKAPGPTEIDGYLVFRQGAYPDRLGSGSGTIARQGCLLCALTMATTKIGTPTRHWPKGLDPRELDPREANRLLRNAHAFRGSELKLGPAAAALGMSSDQWGWEKIGMPALVARDVTWIQSHLQAGFPVVGHVDYRDSRGKKPNPAHYGDHWVLLTSRRGDGIVDGIDPATGGRVSFTTSPRSALGGRASSPRTTALDKGVLFGWGQGGSPDQTQYVVVRFSLLSPLTGGFSAAI